MSDDSLINNRGSEPRLIGDALNIPCPYCARTIPPGDEPIPSLARNILMHRLECERCNFYLSRSELQESTDANKFNEIVNRRIAEMQMKAAKEKTGLDLITEMATESFNRLSSKKLKPDPEKVIIKSKRKRRRVEF